jgi:hypothetical protein
MYPVHQAAQRLLTKVSCSDTCQSRAWPASAWDRALDSTRPTKIVLATVDKWPIVKPEVAQVSAQLGVAWLVASRSWRWPASAHSGPWTGARLPGRALSGPSD